MVLVARILFLFNILKTNGGIRPNFVYSLILTRSRFGSVCIKFCKFVRELWPLNVSFPLNILRTNGQNLTKFCIHFNIDKIKVGIVTCNFLQICNRVKALN